MNVLYPVLTFWMVDHKFNMSVANRASARSKGMFMTTISDGVAILHAVVTIGPFRIDIESCQFA
jgi:hypothetical protein